MECVLLFFLGVCFGFLVNLFNNFWTKRALEGRSGRKAQLLFTLRLLICAAAMFLVRNHVAALLGTALGLVLIKNYILIKTLKDMYIQKRKG